MARLNKLQPLVKSPKRVGRGGKRGGTSGKGHKGQSARSGGSVGFAFEGGQTPLFRRLPKRGFSNFDFKNEIIAINIGRINDLFENGAVVTKEALIELGAIKPSNKLHAKKMFILKVLGGGTLSKKLTIHADAFSASAIELVERNGGKVELIKEM